MANQQIIIPASDQIVGDITSCRIENQVLIIDKSSAISLTEKTTYIAYDVCNKEILSTYTVPSITGLGFLLSFLMGAIILFIFGAILEGNSRY